MCKHGAQDSFFPPITSRMIRFYSLFLFPFFLYSFLAQVTLPPGAHVHSKYVDRHLFADTDAQRFAEPLGGDIHEI